MSILVPINGVNYIIPTPGETGWGSNLDAFFVAIGASTLQKTGGNFLLTSEIDFGVGFGLKSLYYKAESGIVATTGTLRLASADPGIAFRNNANSGDLVLTTNASDQLLYNGHIISTSGGIIELPDGSAAAPSLTFAAQTDLGLYRISNEALGFAVGGVGIAGFVASGLLPISDNTFTIGGPTNRWSDAYATQFVASAGSLSAPSYTFNGSSNYGWYLESGSTIAASVAGAKILEIAASNVQFSTQAAMAASVPGGDLFFQITNTSNTGAGTYSVYNGTGAGNFAIFGTSYVGSRIGRPAAGYVVLETTGANGLLIGTNDATPVVIGTNAAAAISIDASQVVSFVDAPIFSALTASTVPYISAGKVLTSSAVTPTELGYVSGVTSAIQTQLNAKISSSLTSAHLLIGNASNIATDTAMSGDVSITNTGVTSVNNVQNGVITNAMVNASAAIAYSKLNLTGDVVNADISASAAIARSKIAAGTAWRLLADDGSGNITEITFGTSGQVLTATGTTSLPTFQNVAGTGTVNTGTQFQLAYYATSTNAVSGLTLITANRALASDANGLPVASATTATELGFVSGVTSAIQTQINSKLASASGTFTGTLTGPNILLTDTSNQIVLGTTRTVTITAPTPATSSRTWTIPDIGSNGTFAALEAAQTFTALNTFTKSGNAILVSSAASGTASNIYIHNTQTATGSSATLALEIAATGSGSEASTSFKSTTASASMGIEATVNDFVLVYNSTSVNSANIGLRMNGSTGAISLLGTATNDSASTGLVGEYVESNVTSDTNFPTSTQFGDGTSISLTAGDWDVTGLWYLNMNGSTTTVVIVGISTTTGNSSTGLSTPVNELRFDIASGSLPNGVMPATIPSYRVSIASTTTVYAKVSATYSAGTPQYRVALRARRRR